jgi:GAF domain-containing protein
MTDSITPIKQAPAGSATDELLQSVVDVARAIFGAAASSIMLRDAAAGELVFRSVSGAGAQALVGRRFPVTSGIAGWVAASGEPMIVGDLARNSIFNREFAESTQYTPDVLMAAPLVSGDDVLGVLEVLDPVPQSRSSLSELDLLALFARQAAIALRVVTSQGTATGLALAPEDKQAAMSLMAGLRQLLGLSPALP